MMRELRQELVERNPKSLTGDLPEVPGTPEMNLMSQCDRHRGEGEMDVVGIDLVIMVIEELIGALLLLWRIHASTTLVDAFHHLPL